MITDEGKERYVGAGGEAMKWRILRVFFCDRIDNQTIRQMRGVEDAVVATRQSKIRWTRCSPC